MGKTKRQQITSRTDFFYYAFRNILLVGLPFLIISTVVLSRSSIHSFATTSGLDNLSLTLSTSCTINSILAEPHTIGMGGGQYEDEIGSTRINAYCNDGNGYGIYAIGSSGDTDGNTDLINSADDHYNIHTGIYDSNNITVFTPSSWSMKLTAGTGSGIDTNTGNSIPLTPPTIVNNYDSYNIVPNNYTLVAKRTSGTNMTIDTDVTGSYFTTTYAIYATNTQPAGTYNGKVKYAMIHPSSNANNISTLEAAFAAAGKVKGYSDGTSSNLYYAMQDMTTDICNSVTSNGEITATQLIDTRDNKLYWVTKEKDNHCWMTQNLDLDINGTNTTLNSNNTDISADPSISGTGIYGTNGGYTVDNGVYTWNPGTTTANITVDFATNKATGWDNQYLLPRSAEGGGVYYYPPDSTGVETRYDTLKDCTDAGHTAADCKHYHVGNYYNYTAAVASNNTDIGTFNVGYTNADNSICPKNWRLPVATNDGGGIMEFGQLLFDSGITKGVSSAAYTDNGFKNIRKSPLWFVRSGGLNGGTLYNPASVGYYWSSTVYSGKDAYRPGFGSGSADPARNGSRDDGWSVRCIAR